LVNARIQFESDLLPIEEFRQIERKAVEQTVRELDQIAGSTILTDGEQTKPSFLTYPIYDLVFDRYKFDEKCFCITFSDGKSMNTFFFYIYIVINLGHVRTLPRLVKAPFQYATYAYKYLDVAKKLTKKPIKQAVITASALSMVYAPHLLKTYQIENYSHEQFLKDLIHECEKDIRLCLGEFISHLLCEIESILFENMEHMLFNLILPKLVYH
jgi:5-methyltetrahydropteroyltriglutamate--homocysteine methyltransferase